MRLEWKFLPPPLRSEIERRCASPVVSGHSCDFGYTSGFASVLTCADGTRHFVKAASVTAQGRIATGYREEIRRLAVLPEIAPAPRLRWALDGDWVAFSTEFVDGVHPARPWRLEQLTVVLDSVERMATDLTPAPAIGAPRFVEEHATMPAAWNHLRAIDPDLPHLEDAAALAAMLPQVCDGDTLLHTDLRDDNVLLGDDPSTPAWICDWNWPTVGARWIDIVMLLIGPRGDGLDVDAILAERALTRDVPAEHVDALLSALTGYYFEAGDQPEVSTSPYLRLHQRWQAEVCWEWLAERRGW